MDESFVCRLDNGGKCYRSEDVCVLVWSKSSARSTSSVETSGVDRDALLLGFAKVEQRKGPSCLLLACWYPLHGSEIVPKDVGQNNH